MKFKNMKRFATAAMAGALALSMSAPAFATATPNTTNITGNYNAIKLAVTVPTTGKAVINPYGLPYKLGDSTISGQQITTGAALMIQNKSEVALKVEAEVSGTGTTGVTLDANDAGTDYDAVTTKNIYVKFEAFEAAGITADNASETATVNAAFAALDSANAKLTADVLAKAQASDPGTAATGTLILREGSAEGTLQDYGAAFFRLTGKAAKKATWATTDGFTATIAFTFTPDKFEKPTGGALAVGSSSLVLAADNTKTTTITLSKLELPAKVTPKKVTWTVDKDGYVEIVDTSVLTAGSVAIKGTVTGLKATPSSTKVGITVTVLGSDGINYVTSLASGDKIEIADS